LAIATAEWALKAEPDEDNQTAARVDMAAREAAAALVEKQFEKDATKVLQSIKINREAVDDFAKEVESLARMCNDESEAAAVAKLEKDAILSRAQGGKPIIESDIVAESLVERIKEKCDSKTLNLDYFIKSANLHGKEHCGSSFLQASHLKKAEPHLKEFEFHAKAAMALHDDSNRLGHHVVHHLRQHTDHEGEEHERPSIFMNHSLVSLVHAAAKAPLSELHLQRLHYLDEKNYADLHGDTREAHCAERGDMASDQPDHWSLHNEDVKAYVNCICVQRRPSLVCQAVHAENIARAKEVADAVIDEHGAAAHHEFAEQMDQLSHGGTLATVAGTSEIQTYANQSLQGIPFGPCAEDPVSCTVCSEGLCASFPFSGVSFDADTNPLDKASAVKSVLNFLTSNFHHPKPPCFSASCSACIGLKPGDGIKAVVTIGAATECNGWGVFFSTFALSLDLEMCISAGPLQKIYDMMGKKLSKHRAEHGFCFGLPTISYYPFIGKMEVTYSLRPWWLGKAVEFSLGASWPVHGVAPAVGHHCWFNPATQPSGTPTFMNRMMFEGYKKALGTEVACSQFRNAYPGCPWSQSDGHRVCKQRFMAGRRSIWVRVKTYSFKEVGMKTRCERDFLNPNGQPFCPRE